MKEQSLLGKTVRDKVTGFNGIATSKIEFLNGCIQYCVKPKMGADGKMPEGEYIDVEQLEVVNEKKVDVQSTPSGGPSAKAPTTNQH